MFNNLKQNINIEYPASRIEHRVSSIEHLVSSIEHLSCCYKVFRQSSLLSFPRKRESRNKTV